MADLTSPSVTPEIFSSGGIWPNPPTQGLAWPHNTGSTFASTTPFGMTPSPGGLETTENLRTSQGFTVLKPGYIPLHVGAIPAKSRVETQINIRLTLERLPAGIHHVHLPTHTIAKAKLLHKDIPLPEETLELQTFIVCTSAMGRPGLREKALRLAAEQSNQDVQARGIARGMKNEEEENIPEDEKAANGGEVRICANCINRERKRAARKKLKKEEEQAHWEKFETERIIVFNTNEYKQWQEWQASPRIKDSGTIPTSIDLRPPTATAVQITAPMRIACYCRHQHEKDGFQVIFTMKTHTGKVVAQAMTDSILITDDHKTHAITSTNGSVWYDSEFPSSGFGSQSMIDIASHMPMLPSSKSTGNLQAMAFRSPTGLGHSGSLVNMSSYGSHNTSGTLTPRNLSRPASPTGLAQAGPAKKRKSSNAHRRMPSNLTMTKVETGQPLIQSFSGGGPFSPPASANYKLIGGDGPFVGLSNMQRPTSLTQPPTPTEHTPLLYGALQRNLSYDQSAFQALYSNTSSAQQSRSNSPVMHGLSMPSRSVQQQNSRPNPFVLQHTSTPLASQDSIETTSLLPPVINKIVPASGSMAGGIEVSIYGQNFTPGMDVTFGDSTASATTCWGDKAICCVLPRSIVDGDVLVTVSGPMTGSSLASTLIGQQHPSFRYTAETTDARTMEMALKFLTLEMTGTEVSWESTAQNAANAWMNVTGELPNAILPETVAGGGIDNVMPGAFPGL